MRSSRLRTVAACSCVVAIALIGSGCGGRSEERGLPEEVLRRNVLGTAYLGQQKWAEAEAAFEAALELRPDEPLLLNNLAVALLQQGRVDEARDLLQQAIASDPQSPHAQYNLGLILKSLGQFESAATHFEVVRNFDPDDLMTHYNLGLVYSRVGREAEAEERYRAALALDPTHVSALYALGRLLLQRGDQEQGAALISRSQEIRARSGLDEAVGSQYGEQGPYAMGADYAGDALAAPPPIEVRFSELAQGALSGDASAEQWSLGPRAGDGRPTVFVVDGAGVLRAFGSGGISAPLLPDVVRAVAAGDVDDDGAVELVVLASAEGRLRTLVLEPVDEVYVTAEAPGAELSVDGEPTVADLVLVDHDHDGDLDTFLCWSSVSGGGCALGTNDGSGNFETKASAAHGFDADLNDVARLDLAFSDMDNDRDVDLLLARPGRVALFANQRDGTFDERSDSSGLGAALADATGALAVADVNKDGWMDLVLGVRGGLVVYENRSGKLVPSTRFESDEEEEGSVAVLDFDNDGFLDLARSGAGGVVIHRNRGADGWPLEEIVTAGVASSGGASPVAAFDADGDGDQDLVACHRDGTGLVLLDNDGGNANRWIRVSSRGVADNRFGIGSKVELLAGALRQKFEITRPLPLHAGLGSRRGVQSVRFLWPSGILQDEIELSADQTVEVAELDRKGTSCPLLYARRDGAWRFVSDFLGGSAIGYLRAPGVYGTPDTDEYVKIEGGITPEPDGTLRLRVNNQLEEVIWIDQTQLIVVDHPAGTEVFPNERLMPGPPWPEFVLYASGDVRGIAGARGVPDGVDLTDLLARSDRRYARNFELLRFKGYAEPHAVELDLGRLPADERVVLLLDGWIDYADSSANRAAWQAGLRLSPPRLTVADGRGGWRETGHRMGFPAGLPKTMAVELTGLFPSADHRVRIETNVRIYWDRARVLVGGRDVPTRVQRLRPQDAELRFGGFPAQVGSDAAAPLEYDPAKVSSTSPWGAHVGRYTAFGEVGSLLAAVDDRFVTTRSGDEIELRFPAPQPPPRDWTRTYLFFADGFGKDMDPNSAAAVTVGPIPFHGMPGYPYSESVAPAAAVADEQPPRLVLESPRGRPGALPQPLARRAEDDAP